MLPVWPIQTRPASQASSGGAPGPVQGGEVLAREDEHRGLVVKLRDELPGLDNFVGVARSDHQEPGNRAQRRNLLDGLMGRSILAHPDRVMRENVDDRQLHDGG